MSKVVPFNMRTADQVLASIGCNPEPELETIIILRQNKDGTVTMTSNAMTSERMFFLGAIVQNVALSNT